MKIYIIAFFTLLLYSCTSSNEDQAIEDYVSTIGTTKTDMHFNLLSKEVVKEVKAQDSIDFFLKEIKGFSDPKVLLDTLEKRVVENANVIKEREEKGNMGRHMKAFVENLKTRQPILERIV